MSNEAAQENIRWPTCGQDDCQQSGICDGYNCLESGRVPQSVQPLQRRER